MPREEQRPEVPAHGLRGSFPPPPVLEGPRPLCLQPTPPKQGVRFASFPGVPCAPRGCV